MRTDGVHCRESAGIGPVNLKVVPATGAAFSCITIGRCCFFPTPTKLLVSKVDVQNTGDDNSPNRMLCTRGVVRI